MSGVDYAWPPGEFRDRQNWIGGLKIDQARFVPPPADNVPDCMDDLISMLQYVPAEEDQIEIPIMIRMAVRDFLSNAVKYTRGKDPATIAVGSHDEGGDTVFWVKDNGVGFDMRYAGKLFGVFQRLHRVEDFEGTGIGLANARRVVERHGGRTWAEGVEGQGATFYFALPKGPK